MTSTQPSTETPKSIRFSTSFLWVALTLGLALQFMYTDWDFSLAFTRLTQGLILVFALHAYLIVGISKGRNSARWISVLLFAGGLFLAPPSIDGFANTPFVVLTEIAQVCAQFLAFIGLFTRPSNAWFKACSVGTFTNAR